MLHSPITQYFDATEHREAREDLVFAVQNIGASKVAIDCGCGAGADINYLITNGFTVHGFDLEKESIDRCTRRFKGNNLVSLTRASFSTFNYPQASLVVADASLFFCPQTEFKTVWQKIVECLNTNGVFCGSFLGHEDTMASDTSGASKLWPTVCAFEESEVRSLFKDFEVLRFNEHRSHGKNTQGIKHQWHLYQVVARKLQPNANASTA